MVLKTARLDKKMGNYFPNFKKKFDDSLASKFLLPSNESYVSKISNPVWDEFVPNVAWEFE